MVVICAQICLDMQPVRCKHWRDSECVWVRCEVHVSLKGVASWGLS